MSTRKASAATAVTQEQRERNSFWAAPGAVGGETATITLAALRSCLATIHHRIASLRSASSSTAAPPHAPRSFTALRPTRCGPASGGAACSLIGMPRYARRARQSSRCLLQRRGVGLARDEPRQVGEAPRDHRLLFGDLDAVSILDRDNQLHKPHQNQ